MFAKFNHQYHHHQQQIHLPKHEEEEESEASPNSNNMSDGVRSASKKAKPDPDSSDCFGGGEEAGTIEVGKRPRGRPSGSKNKPKPPLVMTREAGCAMRPVFLELPVGLDIIDAIARFTHRRNLGLTVLSASGSVTNVSFRQPGSGGGIVKFHGRFEILSISATFLPPSLPITSSPSPLPSSFTISLVGPQGQIIGGSIAGSLITSTTVCIVAASFDNPTYHQLPVEVVGMAPSKVDQQKHQHEESCSNPFKVNYVDSSLCDGGDGGMSIYHVPPLTSHQDLIWIPTPRSSSPPF